jgi:hypothetical protein
MEHSFECPSREEASQAALKQLPTCHTTQEISEEQNDSQKRTNRDFCFLEVPIESEDPKIHDTINPEFQSTINTATLKVP